MTMCTLSFSSISAEKHVLGCRNSFRGSLVITASRIAIEKPGKDPKEAANYRPISLLSVSYKLLERLVLQRITPTVEALLSPDQVGFRHGRSTCDQVAALTTYIENGFQKKLKTGAVFLDLTAAYDTVWHIGFLRSLPMVYPVGSHK